MIRLARRISLWNPGECRDRSDINRLMRYSTRLTRPARPACAAYPRTRIARGKSKNEGGGFKTSLRVKLSGVDPQAWSHEVEYAPIGADGVVGKWMSQPVTSVASLVAVTGLTPGVTYTFHARSLGRLGFSEWSDSVIRPLRLDNPNARNSAHKCCRPKSRRSDRPVHCPSTPETSRPPSKFAATRSFASTPPKSMPSTPLKLWQPVLLR
jgi:hypothetical protein